MDLGYGTDAPKAEDVLTYSLRMKYPVYLHDMTTRTFQTLCDQVYNAVMMEESVKSGPIPPSKISDFHKLIHERCGTQNEGILRSAADALDLKMRTGGGDLVHRDKRSLGTKEGAINRIKKKITTEKRWEIRKAWWSAKADYMLTIFVTMYLVAKPALKLIHTSGDPVWNKIFYAVWRIAYLYDDKNTGVHDNEYRGMALYTHRVRRGKFLVTHGLFTLDALKYLFLISVSILTLYLIYRGLRTPKDPETLLFTVLPRCVGGAYHFTNCVMPQRMLDPEVDDPERIQAVLDPAMYADMPRTKGATGNDVRMMNMGGTMPYPVMVEQLRILMRTASYGVGCVCAHHFGWPMDLVAVNQEVLQGACFRDIHDLPYITVEVDDHIFGNRTILMPPVARVEYYGYDGEMKSKKDMQRYGLCVARCAILSGRSVRETICE